MTDKPNTFFMDDQEIDIREGETIFRAGRRFENRSLIFFAILLVLAIATFAAVQRYAPGG